MPETRIMMGRSERERRVLLTCWRAVLVCAALVVNVTAIAGGGGECEVKRVMAECNETTSAEAANGLLSKLLACGMDEWDALVAYSRGRRDVGCRTVTAMAVARTAGKDQGLVTRGFLDLAKLAREEEFEEFFPSWCRDVGTVANDGLIAMLGSRDIAVRRVAIECLLDVNESRIANRADLRAYSPEAGSRQREEWVRLWKEWWGKTRQDVESR